MADVKYILNMIEFKVDDRVCCAFKNLKKGAQNPTGIIKKVTVWGVSILLFRDQELQNLSANGPGSKLDLVARKAKKRVP